MKGRTFARIVQVGLVITIAEIEAEIDPDEHSSWRLRKHDRRRRRAVDALVAAWNPEATQDRTSNAIARVVDSDLPPHLRLHAINRVIQTSFGGADAGYPNIAGWLALVKNAEDGFMLDAGDDRWIAIPPRGTSTPKSLPTRNPVAWAYVALVLVDDPEVAALRNRLRAFPPLARRLDVARTRVEGELPLPLRSLRPSPPPTSNQSTPK